MDLLGFALLSFSSVFILIDPITVTIVYVSLTKGIDRSKQRQIARDAAVYALIILLIFAVGGYGILQLFGITLAALRIGGGVLLFLIGIEMVYARMSLTKQPSARAGDYAEDIAITPLAIPIIAGPGAITTVVVLTGEGLSLGWIGVAIVLASILIIIALVYYVMLNSQIIAGGIREKEFRVVNRVLGLLLLAIGVQFIIDGIKAAIM